MWNISCVGSWSIKKTKDIKKCMSLIFLEQSEFILFYKNGYLQECTCLRTIYICTFIFCLWWRRRITFKRNTGNSLDLWFRKIFTSQDNSPLWKYWWSNFASLYVGGYNLGIYRWPNQTWNWFGILFNFMEVCVVDTSMSMYGEKI